MGRGLGVCLGTLLALSPELGTPASAPPPRRAGLASLLGPAAGLAASVQWIRVHAALDEGRPALALARAQLALELDPGATHGWLSLARHQGLYLASVTREPDPERRARWLEAALQGLERGEELARQPAQLALTRGLLLVEHASREAGEQTPWPGGRETLLAAAVEAFSRSAQLGHPEGALLSERAAALGRTD